MNPSNTTILARGFWTTIGPLLLLTLLAIILTTGRGWLTAVDVIFFLALGGLLAARVIEHRGGDPQTATGQPATQDDLRFYLMVTPLAGLIAWVLANAIGNHWLQI
jgi:hypothetical protein